MKEITNRSKSLYNKTYNPKSSQFKNAKSI